MEKHIYKKEEAQLIIESQSGRKKYQFTIALELGIPREIIAIMEKEAMSDVMCGFLIGCILAGSEDEEIIRLGECNNLNEMRNCYQGILMKKIEEKTSLHMQAIKESEKRINEKIQSYDKLAAVAQEKLEMVKSEMIFINELKEIMQARLQDKEAIIEEKDKQILFFENEMKKTKDISNHQPKDIPAEEEKKEDTDSLPPVSESKSFLQRFYYTPKEKKRKKRELAELLQMLRASDFNEEQLEIIVGYYKQGVEFEQLKKIVDVTYSAEKMKELLLQFQQKEEYLKKIAQIELYNESN